MNAIVSQNNFSFGDGNQAIAWAAQDAGVHYVAHYPGSPVNRVVPEIENDSSGRIIINHALNEHIAALSAMGASLTGARSLLVMKHVGLNIAADPLNYAGVSKIKGGMVIVVGTDPGARTSTGEEDVHWYAPQFNFPLLEPVSTQDVYEQVKQAFSLSEKTQTPVLVFVPGRLAYLSSDIQRTTDDYKEPLLVFNKNPETLINVGARAVRNHRDHIERIQACQQTRANPQTQFNPDAPVGIVTRGATYSVVCEQIEQLQLTDQIHLININRPYPLNVQEFIDFAESKSMITVIEDQDGFLETMIKQEAFGKVNCNIQGKSIFPAWGEVTDTQVRHFLTDQFNCVLPKQPVDFSVQVPERPGTFCEGCPHRSTFFAIDKAIQKDNGIIGGDIGCSSLPPHRTDWLLCMNAGIGISQGIAHLLPDQPMVSTGGEGSLFHGGLTSLQSAVENNINLTHILLDNRSIAMTGHQASPTTSNRVDVKKLLEAIGVTQIFEVNAFKPSEMTHVIQSTNAINGVKVIWVRGDCALLPDAETMQRRQQRTLKIDNDRCNGCSLCYSELQCPAIIQNSENNTIHILMDRCRRCTACLDVCPNNAIIINEPVLEVHYA